MIEQIEQIVPADQVIYWEMIEPKVFYKDDKPYGLVAEVDGLIASTTKNPSLPFTVGMLTHIYHINKTKDIIVITDDPDYFETIKTALEPRGFSFTLKDNILYSRRKKWALQQG